MQKRFRLLANLFANAVGVALLILPQAFAAGPPPVYAKDGMVVSGSRLACEVGVDILRQGGNAFDAAAAVGFALAVTYPHAGNLGGGGFMVACTKDGRALSLDFREKAPGGAHRDLFLDEDNEVIPGASLWSPLASGVPGSVDGLLAMWEELGSGTIARERLIAPAIRLAEDGFELTPALAASLNRNRKRFASNEGAKAIFVRDEDRLWEAGDRLTQPGLAATLRRIAHQGRDGFYQGETAEALVRFMEDAGGLITRDDLMEYESVWREPVRGTFHDFEIVSMGPPSSGGILIVQMLNMLEDHDLRVLGWQSSAYVHLLTEVQRRAYADRAEHMGDTAFWPTPVEGLIEKNYAAKRAKDIDPSRATPSSETGPGKPAPRESSETCHYSVADRFGNAVAVTTTLNAGYGSGIVAPGTGFLLNNEMDDFSAKPGVPNLYGLVGSEANAVEPGKRMLSSMSPTVILDEGKPRFILGSPGGSTIPTTVLQIFLNAAVFGMDIGDAVAAPRHHSQWLPDAIFAERFALSADVQSALRKRGHDLMAPRGGAYIGQANCIEMTEDGLYGAPDPRGDNAALGYTEH